VIDTIWDVLRVGLGYICHVIRIHSVPATTVSGDFCEGVGVVAVVRVFVAKPRVVRVCITVRRTKGLPVSIVKVVRLG
jgi:hypothetical protein